MDDVKWMKEAIKQAKKAEDYDEVPIGCVDVLVDGPFEIDKRDITLKFRGSSNQRIIDVRKSIFEGKVVEISD